MRRRIYIPAAVQADIARRLHLGVLETVQEWDSAAEDEDSLTGHLGALLTTRDRKVEVLDDEIRGTWAWSLSYRKFRGRGPKATEKRVGADGIFELTLVGQGRTEVKSLLFQSKMAGAGSRDLVEQCAKLSTWREAAFVVRYSPDGISAISIDDALGAKGAIDDATAVSLDEFLAQSFVPCLVGDNDLRYHAVQRTLVWQSENAGVVSAHFPIGHRFRIKVTPPGLNPKGVLTGTEIDLDDIHKYRMEATPEDLLSIGSGQPTRGLKEAYRALSKIYHPDGWANFPLEIRDLLTVRTQEINDAFEKLSKK